MLVVTYLMLLVLLSCGVCGALIIVVGSCRSAKCCAGVCNDVGDVIASCSGLGK